jgi:hypothetical protein
MTATIDPVMSMSQEEWPTYRSQKSHQRKAFYFIQDISLHQPSNGFAWITCLHVSWISKLTHIQLYSLRQLFHGQSNVPISEIPSHQQNQIVLAGATQRFHIQTWES